MVATKEEKEDNDGSFNVCEKEVMVSNNSKHFSTKGETISWLLWSCWKIISILSIMQESIM